ncbi:MAG: ribose transport system ATP-binding protein [Verrucomicrobiales bacterium]|jgi:ribose transport system ATP-binding protein
MAIPPDIMTKPPLLQMETISKSFPGVRALHEVSLTLEGGEVLALMGENGAGKSTLIKVLSGAHRPDSGVIRIEGEEVQFTGPTASQNAGVAVIYQELNLIPALTVRENLFLGRDKANALGFIRRGEEAEHALKIFERIGVQLPLETPCSRLTVAQQQLVEIGKALALDAKIMVMDEPSASLSQQEVEHLFEIIAELKRQSIGVIYISHRLEEIERIADRVSVLRDGEHVRTAPATEFTRETVIESMVGRSLDQEFPKKPAEIGKTRLSVSGLTRGEAVRDVSFEVHAGEVLGITGLVGAGRTETARLIFGADRADSGRVELDGELLPGGDPRKAIAAGICLLTEDRKSQGLVLGRSVRENFGLPNLNRLSKAGWVDQPAERHDFGEFVESLSIKIPSQEQLARNLSGGNQQKVVLAKWLERDAGVIIFDEPTRGIDVGAKYEIYLLMNRLAAEGKAIVMISSELPEVIGMSDRILVMREGKIAGEVTDVAAVTQEQLLAMAMGEIESSI